MIKETDCYEAIKSQVCYELKGSANLFVTYFKQLQVTIYKRLSLPNSMHWKEITWLREIDHCLLGRCRRNQYWFFVTFYTQF